MPLTCSLRSTQKQPPRAGSQCSLRYPASRRSEERRVGKECRYWRDWSSDVCSSDLGGEVLRHAAHLFPAFDAEAATAGGLPVFFALPGFAEIGRASCRERV